MARLYLTAPQRAAIRMIEDRCQQGHPLVWQDIATAVGVTPKTLYNWRHSPLFMYHLKEFRLMRHEARMIRIEDALMTQAEAGNVTAIMAFHRFRKELIAELRGEACMVTPEDLQTSYASFIAALFPPYVVERIGRERIGREIHEHLATGMRQAMAARERLGPERA